MSDLQNPDPPVDKSAAPIVDGKIRTVRRFKTCGNPNGRPKGAKNRKTIMKTIAEEWHTVDEGGKQIKRITLELVLIRLRNLALEGNTRALIEFTKRLEKYAPQLSNSKAGYLVVPAPMSQEEWIEKAKKDNEAKRKLLAKQSKE